MSQIAIPLLDITHLSLTPHTAERPALAVPPEPRTSILHPRPWTCHPSLGVAFFDLHEIIIFCRAFRAKTSELLYHAHIGQTFPRREVRPVQLQTLRITPT